MGLPPGISLGMRMQITIELPLPSRLLHPNARPHYMAKAKQTKQHRQWAATSASLMRCDREPWEAVTVLCQFTFRDKRTRDKDNLLSWCKAYFDGIADVGVVRNDSAMTHLPVEIMPPDKNKTGVTITVTKVKP